MKDSILPCVTNDPLVTFVVGNCHDVVRPCKIKMLTHSKIKVNKNVTFCSASEC